MPEWDKEPIAYSDHETVRGLELDDGTYLECFETVLGNQYGETELFEHHAGKREVRWWGWGPHDMTVLLTKDTIQSMFDSGDLEVVDDA